MPVGSEDFEDLVSDDPSLSEDEAAEIRKILGDGGAHWRKDANTPTIKEYPVPTIDSPAPQEMFYPDWTSETSKVIKYSAKFYTLSQAKKVASAVYGKVFDHATDGVIHMIRVPRKPVK